MHWGGCFPYWGLLRSCGHKNCQLSCRLFVIRCVNQSCVSPVYRILNLLLPGKVGKLVEPCCMVLHMVPSYRQLHASGGVCGWEGVW